MNGPHHINLTRTILEALGPEVLVPKAGKLARNAVQLTPDSIASFADFPDRSEDVTVYLLHRQRHSLFGRSLNGLGHFTYAAKIGPGMNDWTYRGWSFKLDESIPLHEVDLPTGNIMFDGSTWAKHLGKNEVRAHPLNTLLWSLKGKATVQIDDLTFPSSAAMVHWLCSPRSMDAIQRREPSAALRIGSILHLLQDICIGQHRAGYLLAGHAEQEASDEVKWFTDARLREKCRGVACTAYVSAPLRSVSLRAVIESSAQEQSMATNFSSLASSSSSSAAKLTGIGLARLLEETT